MLSAGFAILVAILLLLFFASIAFFVALSALIGLIVVVAELGAYLTGTQPRSVKAASGVATFFRSETEKRANDFRTAASRIVRSVEMVFQNLASTINEPQFVRQPVQSRGQSIEPIRSRFSVMKAIALSWFAPSCVLGVFFMIIGPLNQDRSRSLRESEVFKFPVSVAFDRAEQKPEWIKAGSTKSGDVERFVLSSKLWSTIEEAQSELQTISLDIVYQDFDRRHHDLFDPRWHRYLDKERLVAVAVKERYIERIQMDFGTMTRLWWLLEISPVVRMELYPEWKVARIENRMFVVGAVILFLTAVANSWSLFANLKKVSKWTTQRAFATCAGSFVLWVLTVAIVTLRFGT